MWTWFTVQSKLDVSESTFFHGSRSRRIHVPPFPLHMKKPQEGTFAQVVEAILLTTATKEWRTCRQPEVSSLAGSILW